MCCYTCAVVYLFTTSYRLAAVLFSFSFRCCFFYTLCVYFFPLLLLFRYFTSRFIYLFSLLVQTYSRLNVVVLQIEQLYLYSNFSFKIFSRILMLIEYIFLQWDKIKMEHQNIYYINICDIHELHIFVYFENISRKYCIQHSW